MTGADVALACDSANLLMMGMTQDAADTGVSWEASFGLCLQYVPRA